MPGSPPGPAGKSDQSTVKDQTSALVPMPSPSPTRSTTGFKYTKGQGVSWELQDAPFVCVVTTLSEASPDEMRVIAWLREHKTEVIAAEADFKVDRRAIAAAIAWEALDNVKPSIRAVGPGKPHLWRLSLFGPTDENMWVKGVEDAHFVPKQTSSNRRALLKTPSGAITYIAATMDLIATIYSDQGSPGVCNPPMRINPGILLNEYQGSDVKKWTERVKTIKTGDTLKPGNPMALWFLSPHNLQLVEDGVGPTDLTDSPTLDKDACYGDYRDVTKDEAATILEKAKLYKGTPYKWGGDNKEGIDCSHLVWRAINDALPAAKFDYIDTAGMPSSLGLRKLGAKEAPISGDVVLFSQHVGFYDAAPPADKAGRNLLSAEGSQTKPTPGVAWGKPEWFSGPTRYFRVRMPCK